MCVKAMPCPEASLPEHSFSSSGLSIHAPELPGLSWAMETFALLYNNQNQSSQDYTQLASM